MNIVVKESDLASCFLSEVNIGEVFYIAGFQENRVFYLKIDDCSDPCVLRLKDFTTTSLSPDTKVFTAKSNLIIDISQNA